MALRRWATWASGVCAAIAAQAAQTAPVLLISIDGLRPADVIDAPARGLKVPTLRALMAQGAYATGVRGVLPTLTYPNHTTVLTGASPARHGIENNLTFDPLQKNAQGWYWYASDIKLPTLWDAAHGAHLKTANVHWPVSVDAPGIDLNLPQIWRTGLADDRKLVRALSTPGLYDRLEREVGPYADGKDESVEADEVRGRFAEALMRDERPDFMTAYFTGLDHIQHVDGPDTPAAHAALERIDAAVGRLIAEARRDKPGVVVAVISDHGFAPVKADVNLFGAFIQAGLVTIDPAKHTVTSWEAEPWFAGGSAGVVLARPNDSALQAKVSGLLKALAVDPRFGVARVIDRSEIAARGGPTQASYFIDFQIGYEMGIDPAAAAVTTPGALKGMHGYFPDHPEMRATFIIAGPGLAKSGALGDVDMRDIAPTLAKAMGVTLPTAEGEPLL